MKPSLKTIALLSTALLSACTSTEDKVNDLLQRHMDAFVFVEGGSFMMGNPGGWSVRRDSLPAHKVMLDSFSIQKYEVTQGDMDLFMEVTGYASSDESYDRTKEQYPNRFMSKLPAVGSWIDAQAFCQWLGKISNRPIDLPTEAQWEYAARSRGQVLRYATDTGEAIEGVNMAAASKGGFTDPTALPLPPGSFPPNPLGLYDMSGNASEWVLDNYQPDYYENSPELNPQGPEKAKTSGLKSGPIDHHKVARGGRFYDFWGNTTVSRLDHPKRLMWLDAGFRCLLHTKNAAIQAQDKKKQPYY
ncbi:formylglycine-generating enzyme family protein [Alkalimarinus coralli]|uniref:formylglycine-generating enzyme family protein n=1 Tax=Alkalimarinus coralli TaxID=2935863 RepID=UPI00202B2F52|nr:SUMF1/EgtB/PvdO family nonheme iron enzyme [Alkalimarinus coralli]